MTALATVLATALAFGGCSHVLPIVDGGTDTDSDSDSDIDTDTDTDSDTDTDTDTDTDECNAPEGITNWGGPCHTTADCPAGTTCYIEATLDDTQGYCAAECCNFGTTDVAYCTDVCVGEEACNFGQSSDGVNFEPPFFCMVPCTNPQDCPAGTDCVDSGSGYSICYGYYY